MSSSVQSSPASMSAPPIRVEQVVKTFGHLRALDDVSFQVHAGETFGIIGPNGSGKTTLMRLLLGLGRATSGHVWIFDQTMPSRQAATQIGYMTQARALYSELRVRENLAFFARLYGLTGAHVRQRTNETLTLVDLADRAASPVQTLSRGMRQRVSLAIALIHQPRLLVLDEPTVGIDPELRRTFWDYFARLNADGVTIIVSTHHMDEAARCQRLALLRLGTLLAVDTPESIRQSSGEQGFERAFLVFAERHASRSTSAV
jgi:ABC-2 type transport system ATP-binding protein